MNNEYKCIEDDKSTVLWIMLIMLILFGLLVFLMMRMRLFFNKKDKEKEEAPDIALQTSIELVGPP
jgi:flagellar basal body-associated protein FliL